MGERPSIVIAFSIGGCWSGNIGRHRVQGIKNEDSDEGGGNLESSKT